MSNTETVLPATSLVPGDRLSNCSSPVARVVDLGDGRVHVTFGHAWSQSAIFSGKVVVTNR